MPLVRIDTAPIASGDERRGDHRDQQVDPAVADAVEAEDADRVGADAEVGGVAERDQAAVAEDQVEAHRGDGEDQDAPRQVEVERLAEREHAPAAARSAAAPRRSRG